MHVYGLPFDVVVESSLADGVQQRGVRHFIECESE
jgi:hypothetical protein